MTEFIQDVIPENVPDRYPVKTRKRLDEFGLSDHERVFADKYLLTMDPTEAFRAAFPKATLKRARADGKKYVRKRQIVDYVEFRREGLRHRITQSVDLEDVTRELAKLSFAKLSDVIEWGKEEVDIAGKKYMRDFVRLKGDSANLDEIALAAVSEISQDKDGCIKLKMHPKIAALSKLAEILAGNAAGKKTDVHVGLLLTSPVVDNDAWGKMARGEDVAVVATQDVGESSPSAD